MDPLPTGRAKFTGRTGSATDFILALQAGLIHGRTYEIRILGFSHGVQYVDVINIGLFNSVMFEGEGLCR